jgi:hypothetical protein
MTFSASGNDFGNYVAVDPHRAVFVVGDTHGALGGPNAGGSDGYIRKYRLNGGLVPSWGRGGTFQFGSVGNDDANGVAIDSSPGPYLYVIGRTDGNLGVPLGGVDAYLLQLQ